MNERIKKLRSHFKTGKIDAFLVTADVNISYLTRFSSSESWLLVSPGKTLYLTDSRYEREVKKRLKGADVVCFRDTMSQAVGEIVASFGIRHLGFDERHLSVASLKKLESCLPKKTKLTAANNLIEDLRAVKDSREIRQIRKAIELNLEAFIFVKRVIRVGMSESELLRKLDLFVRSREARFSFDPIIASGPNSSFPHAKVTDRKFRRDEPVLVDLGIEINGYKSDLTRMFFLGKISESLRKINAVVMAAQEKAISKVKAGVLASAIDQEARNYLSEKNLGKYFGHSLGHGVGLEIHEEPRISQRSCAVLREGMIFAVEPAVYIPNSFGIRIEDMVLVTKQGYTLLSRDRLDSSQSGCYPFK
ncbi:MAG: Xaa-Pro peptidase family protein [Candidatus Omnitrophota bacterium]